MKGISSVFLVAAGLLCLAAASVPARASCVAGTCHDSMLDARFLHGPVAAEQAGAEGCVSCHVPAGGACTASKAGSYEFKADKEQLCLSCHERGTGTQHTRAGSRCLSCHSPHGSDSDPALMRSG